MSADGELLVRGLAAFRAGRFFEAHEEWEVVWLRANGVDRRRLQGLIQVAAGGVHLASGRTRPAAALLKLALEKLEDAPDELHGIPVAAMRERVREVVDALGSGERADPARLLSLPAIP